MAEPLTVLLRLLAVVVLVGLNGFFVAAEFALVGVRRTRMDELVDQGVSGAGRVRRALDDIERFISGNTAGHHHGLSGPRLAGRAGRGRAAARGTGTAPPALEPG